MQTLHSAVDGPDRDNILTGSAEAMRSPETGEEVKSIFGEGRGKQNEPELELLSQIVDERLHNISSRL